MRVLALVVLCSACTQKGPVQLAHKSALQAQTRGVVMNPHDEDGVVGMSGTTCDVYTDDGSVGGDYDMPTREERVVDQRENEVFGPALLGISRRGVHVYLRDLWEEEEPVMDIELRRVVDARVHPDGLAVLFRGEEGCRVGWMADAETRSEVDVPEGLCHGQLEVDERGDVWVGTPDGVAQVDAEGAVLNEGGELIAVDDGLGLVYTAHLGGRSVQALDGAGAVVWTTEVPGPVTALDDMGPEASVAVMVAVGGMGKLVFLDGATGEQRSAIATPSSSREITVSPSGRTLGVTLRDEVHFFRVQTR